PTAALNRRSSARFRSRMFSMGRACGLFRARDDVMAPGPSSVIGPGEGPQRRGFGQTPRTRHGKMEMEMEWNWGGLLHKCLEEWRKGYGGGTCQYLEPLGAFGSPNPPNPGTPIGSAFWRGQMPTAGPE